MFDFGSVAPELTSARLYAGPGAGSLMAAAGAWRDLAAQLDASASAYQSVLQSLSVTWTGPSAVAMSNAATPYVAWLREMAAKAGQLGVQVEAAASAFYTAYTMAVAPAVIAANRIELMELVATNLLGQNGPAIAKADDQYAEMWAQDAAAMNQ
jgi:PPE-repeat protein